GVLYVQQFIPRPGWAPRLLVLGGRALAAMRRQARGDWRTNVAQGGRAVPVRPTAGQEELALRAAAAVGAPLAGVDLLPGPDGAWYVLEVNAVPGWRALAPVTGVDVAAAIIHFLAFAYGGRRGAPPLRRSVCPARLRLGSDCPQAGQRPPFPGFRGCRLSRFPRLGRGHRPRPRYRLPAACRPDRAPGHPGHPPGDGLEHQPRHRPAAGAA